MNEELHWQPMASRDLDREQPPHLRISGAGRRPPGPQAQNRMALGVKGGGMLGQWYTLSPPPPVGAMPKTPSNPVRSATNAVPGVTPPSLLAAAPGSAPPASSDSS